MDGKISNFEQVAYIRRYVMQGGKSDGIKIIEINNGTIRLILNESKNLDISQLWHKGTNVSFLSKNGLVGKDLPFLNRFEGGMLYTCGLDAIGNISGHELHGNIHNTASQIISTICNEDKIEVVGVTRLTSLFGENLELIRKISTSLFADTITINDTLTNNGTKSENYCLLYHNNLGYPMIDEGVEIVADEVEVAPRTNFAKERENTRKILTNNIDNEEEQCYFINHRIGKVEVVNRKIGKKFSLYYQKETLPCFVEWHSYASQDYALGLEPCTSYLDDKFQYKVIKPNEKIEFGLKYEITNLSL